MRKHCFSLYNTLCEIGIVDEIDDYDDLFAAAEEEARRIDRLLNRYDVASSLSRLNSAYCPGIPYPIEPELYRILEVSNRFHRLTDGAFQIATGGMSDLWDFENPAPVKPSRALLLQQAERIGRSQLCLDPDRCSVTITEPGITLDLGGLGKGYAVDCVASLLRQHSIGTGYVDFGGNLFAWGTPEANGSGWVTGIQDPTKPRGTSICRLSLQDAGISTSAGYDRFFCADGQFFHHILDPQLGTPVKSDLNSVTIVASSAMTADILSTSCFLLGSQKASRLLDTLSRDAALGGVFILKDGSIAVAGSLCGQLEIKQSKRSTTVEKETIQVFDTKIKNVSRKNTANGRSYAVVTIELAGIDFQPGQFMMIQAKDKEVRWGYDYMILSADPDSVTVIAPLQSDLYQQFPGNEIAAWGPRGTGPLVSGEGPAVLVASPATYASVLPFILNETDRCRLLLLVSQDPQQELSVMGEQISSACIPSVDSLCVALEGMDESQILVALNPEEMLEYSKFAADDVRKRTWMYMPTQIGCGIGGCTGCVVHSPDAPFGIKICEEGPFLPLCKTDITADIHSFITRM